MTAKILLVDDNAIQGATRKAILERCFSEIVVANSAAQALEWLADPALAAELGMIITDHLMPGMNGPEFVATLRENLPSIPVLVLSGLPDADLEYSGLSVLIRHKPFPPEALISLCHDVLDEPISRTA